MITLVAWALTAAAVAAYFVALAGNPVIALLKRHAREPIKSGSPDVARLHAAKEGTPTLGGLLVLPGILLTACPLLQTNLAAAICVWTVVALAALGLVDDLAKVLTARRGIAGRVKLAGIMFCALIAAMLFHQNHAQHSQASAAFDFAMAPPGLYLGLCVLAIAGSANAVNLTDGLDGLSAGCLAIAFTCLTVMGCLTANEIAHNAGALARLQDWTLVSAASAGACGAFLIFNRHPARVFLGDTGALALGGLLAACAIGLRQELMLPLIGGVFVVETISVMMQVFSFRLLGRRVFRCAPLHHHFQLRGWEEKCIVRRFWLAGVAASALTLGIVSCAAIAEGLKSLVAPPPNIVSDSSHSE